MAIIYHITTAEEWNRAKQTADAEGKFNYYAFSLESEGFIHCSTDRQVDAVLNRYFKEQEGLVKLVIETERLTSPLKYELAESAGEEFPHIYGPVNSEAVTDVVAL